MKDFPRHKKVRTASAALKTGGHRNLRRFVAALALFALILFWVLPHIVYARAGGGGGYGGGGGGGSGGGGGGGGGDIIWLVYYWVEFCAAYPYIGLPVTAVAIVIIIKFKRVGHEAYRSNVIYRGDTALNFNQEAAVVAALRSTDPSFDMNALRDRLKTAFLKIQSAWCAQKLETVRPFISDSIQERFSLQLKEQQELGYRDRMEDLRVEECALAAVVSEGGYDSVDVGITGQAKDYRVDLKNEQYLQGSRESEEFTEYWTLLRRRGAHTKPGQAGLFEGHCPNCGAAIEMNQSANCTYCKALLRSGEHDWVLVKITQACDWRPRPIFSLPGVAELQREDPDFNLAYLEDHASVMFWRWIMAWRAGGSEPLRKVAPPEFCASFASQLAADAAASGRSYYGECAVGSVETRGILPGAQGPRAVIEIHWDGVRYLVGQDGRAQRTERSAIRRTLFVLTRKAGVRSKVLDGVGSAHCPGCGAPQALSTADKCEYCGAVLNDGALGWNLDAVYPWSSNEAVALAGELESLRRGQVVEAERTGVAPKSLAALPANTPSAVALIGWMARLAQADGPITDDERQLLVSTAAKNGVEDERVRMILAAAERGKLELPEPSGLDETRDWLEALAAMALVKGRVSSADWALLYAMGESHELTKADINLLVQKTKLRLYRDARGELKKARELRRQG